MNHTCDDLPTMTGAEWGGARDHLGLTHAALAALLGVKEARSVQRWEDETHDIPAERAAQMDALIESARALEDFAVGALSQTRTPVLVTYRTDEDFHAAHPTSPYTARWHRSLTGRVARRLDQAAVLYAVQHHKARRPLTPPPDAVDVLTQWGQPSPASQLDDSTQGERL